MSTGETANLWGSVVAAAGSGAFIVAYAALARGWWRSAVGRLLMLKASAIVVFMSITIAIYALDTDPDPLRWLRGILAAAFGAAMFVQAALVVRVQARAARPSDSSPTDQGA